MAYFVIFVKTKTMKNGNWVFWLIGLGSLALMTATLFYNYTYATGLACDQQGVFGDMFGASNAFFTGLSFTGVIIAILLQRQELKLQRNDLELTRDEMKLTRNEFETQNVTLTKQQFENTFFQMLSLFHENIEKIHSSNRGDSYNGKDVFTVFRSDINGNIDTLLRKRIVDKDSDTMPFPEQMKAEKRHIKSTDLVGSFWSVYRIYDNILSPYFSTLKIILKFVHESYIEDKHFYASIISSQLSRDECLVLFMHTLSLTKDSMERNLIEKYNIVDDLDMDKLPNPTIFLDYLEQKK